MKVNWEEQPWQCEASTTQLLPRSDGFAGKPIFSNILLLSSIEVQKLSESNKPNKSYLQIAYRFIESDCGFCLTSRIQGDENWNGMVLEKKRCWHDDRWGRDLGVVHVDDERNVNTASFWILSGRVYLSLHQRHWTGIASDKHISCSPIERPSAQPICGLFRYEWPLFMLSS